MVNVIKQGKEVFRSILAESQDLRAKVFLVSGFDQPYQYWRKSLLNTPPPICLFVAEQTQQHGTLNNSSETLKISLTVHLCLSTL